jgi:hypothetical protein
MNSKKRTLKQADIDSQYESKGHKKQKATNRKGVTIISNIRTSKILGDTFKKASLRTQIENLIAFRRAEEYKELISNSISNEEEKIFKTWYREEYMPLEADALEAWKFIYKDLVGQETHLDNFTLLLNFNEFMSKIWCKY